MQCIAATCATPRSSSASFAFRSHHASPPHCSSRRRCGGVQPITITTTTSSSSSSAPLLATRLSSSSSAFSRKSSSRAVPAAAGDVGRQPLAEKLQLGAMVVVWYLLNICFNISNKLVLKAVPFPCTVTAFQFASGSFLIFLMWAANLYPKPKLSYSQLGKIVPLALVHVMGNLFTNMSLGKVAVSFTHTIKAMEPFFSVLLSVLFLAETPSLWVLASLVPIVGGVALASLTEASFNWIGFWSAMASNITNQSRNVFSKKLLGDKEESLDDVNLFSILTVMSFLLSAPLMLFAEGIKFNPSYLQSTGINLQELCIRALISGFCFHTYQQVSYMILARISPVTHSVANCVKRVVVIVSSVLFFRTPISPINALGTGMALAGVFLYSRLKRKKPKTA